MKSCTYVKTSEVGRFTKSAPMKTSPLDQLSLSVVKTCSAEFSVIIAHIANTSLKAGRFPSSWNAGLMAPLLKKPGLDDNDFKSVRPVSSLSTLSKLLEHLALARIKPHVVPLPNYNHLQRAYRAAHATEIALVKIVDDILSIVESVLAIALARLDISAALDTVSHRKLLARLEYDFST